MDIASDATNQDSEETNLVSEISNFWGTKFFTEVTNLVYNVMNPTSKMMILFVGNESFQKYNKFWA